MTSDSDQLPEESEYFLHLIEQKRVDDVTLQYFYKARPVTFLFLLSTILAVVIFSRQSGDWRNDLFHAGIFVTVAFLFVSVLILPNGPFIRPHPAIWRMIFGASVLYFFVMTITSFLSLNDARAILHYLRPDLINMSHSDILAIEYAVECNKLSWKRVYSHMDVFAFGHVLGWIAKAILLRNSFLTWTLSINWEITEIAFCPILPNFCECWWDSVVLDVIICNGIGIYIGMKICRWLEMRHYHWVGIRSIKGTSGKIKRAVLQFTPRSWLPTRWLDADSSIQRVVMLSLLIILFQFAELNAFFLKHLFIVKPSDYFTWIRLVFIATAALPAVRQFYLYVTDPHINRIGSHLWFFVGIVIMEALVCIKFGKEIFAKTVLAYMGIWIAWLIASSIVLVFVCLLLEHRLLERRRRRRKTT